METQSTRTAKVDLIIVGAGLSGLLAAHKVQQKEPSLQIKIIEASNAIGGQIAVTQLGEIGGKWITEDQHHIHYLLQQLQVPMRRRRILSSGSKRCWDLDVGIFAPFAKYELMRYLRELDLMTQYYKPGRFHVRRYSRSMRQHINKRLFFSKSREFMYNLVQLIAGVNADDIKYYEFMSICYTCGSLRMLIDIYIETSNNLLEISSSHLLQALIEKFKYCEILCKRKVSEIHHYRDNVEVIDSEFEVHIAEAIIVAIPWNALQDIYFSPALPMELRKPPLPLPSDKGKYMITSFIAKYNEGYWRTAGYSGNFLSHKPMLMGHEYRPTIYAGRIVHEEAIEPLIRSIVLETLSKYYGENMLLPLEYVQRTYEISTMVNIPFTTPWNRIIFASSATAATCYRGCLGGAVQSGLRAAMNALLIVRPQTVMWQDLAEIQRSEHLFRRHTSWFTLWMSTWNLYNVVCNSILLISGYALYRYITHKP